MSEPPENFQRPEEITKLAARVKIFNPGADVDLLHRSFHHARQAHKGQRRRSGEPFVYHPLRVASIIADLKLDVASICSGLLHDCVEDTTTTVHTIKDQFSEEIAFLVNGVTKLGELTWVSHQDRQAESFRKMLLAMAKDIRVILIKLADRLDNMRTLQAMPPDKQETISKETMEIYAPLANRLGIYWIRAELEDLAFGYLHQEEHKQFMEDLALREEERQQYIIKVEEGLRRLMQDNSIQCTVRGRLKNLWGIFSKMRRTKRRLEQIHDVVAFRIITSSIKDCYAALGVVHENFTPIPGRFKDYLAMPKPNRYQSLHTSLIGPEGERMEVQIRTEEMHCIAEDGIAAHWVYKEDGGGISEEDQKKFSWLRQLVEFQKDLKDPVEFINAVKIDLFVDEVYTFTPQGEVRSFPVGSTPVDFAYAIHSEVGNHCAGARVNGLIVPLRYKLRNGDMVEIITNTNQRPNKDWLKFVVTARARSKVRHFIRREQRAQSKKLGRDLLEREFRKHGYSLVKLQRKGVLQDAFSRLRVGSEEELILQIGFGKLTPLQVLKVAVPDAVETPEEKPGARSKGRLGNLLERMRRKPAPGGILVQDMDEMLVRVAHCCNPVPGDEIIGFITKGRGVTVHQRDCPRAFDLNPERKIEVSWDEQNQVEHPVAVEVRCMDRPGLLSKISAAFSELGVNITTANCRATKDSRAINIFHFKVYNLEHLRQIIRDIKRIKGVYSVDRI